MFQALLNLFRATPANAAPAPVGPPKAPAVAGTWLALAITMVAGFEGLYTHAYKDVVGVPTICYGVTNADRPVHMGDTATKDECKQMLAEDLVRYKAMVDKCIHVAMPPYRTASMVSFVYNVGQGNLCKSSVARGINKGDLHGTRQNPLGCDALMLWNKAGGREIKGLTTRRTKERVFCLRSD